MTGSELRALRLRAGLTQDEAIRLCGVRTATTWSRWERGVCAIDDLKAEAIRVRLQKATRKNTPR